MCATIKSTNICSIHALFRFVCRSIPLQNDVKWELEMERISKQIDGFSGREIAKLAVAWQVHFVCMMPKGIRIGCLFSDFVCASANVYL